MGYLEMLVEKQFIFLLCFSVFHVFYFIYFYMFEIKNSQMLKYFFGHGKIKLPWDSIHFSYLRSLLILYLGHLKGRMQQEDQYLFKTILSGRMVSIENEERTSLADLLQRCRLGTVNMFIKEKREILHIFLTLPARYQVIRAGAKAQLWGWQWHTKEKGGRGIKEFWLTFLHHCKYLMI